MKIALLLLDRTKLDALSTVLSTLRVSSMLSSRFEASGAWSLRFPAYRHFKFGSVLAGSVYLWPEGEVPLRLQPGDFYLLTDGRPFFTASDPDRVAQDGVAIVRGSRDEHGVARYHCAGDADAVSLASGRFTFDDDQAVALLLSNLPPLIHLRATSDTHDSMHLLLGLLRLESEEWQLGAEVARSSLAALALVQLMRTWLATETRPAGWLSALADTRIGKALSVMHAEPGRRWTLESLAGHVAMSRTAFANRFRSLVGQPPLDYLQQWRMVLARKALRESDTSLAKLANDIGYLSETAFSLAFKRSTGVSPGKFRAISLPVK